jgi:hypothetical protein
MNKENVEDFSYYRISLKPPPVYTVFILQTEGDQRDSWHFCIFVIPA